jgi:hypothetical protein
MLPQASDFSQSSDEIIISSAIFLRNNDEEINVVNNNCPINLLGNIM